VLFKVSYWTLHTHVGLSQKYGKWEKKHIMECDVNSIFYTLLRSFPRADASIFLHGEHILKAALAAATALSTSACNNQLKAEEQVRTCKCITDMAKCK
jgi:hypothetical protein